MYRELIEKLIKEKKKQVNIILNKITKMNKSDSVKILIEEINEQKNNYTKLLKVLKSNELSKEELEILVDNISQINQVIEISFQKIDDICSNKKVYYDEKYKFLITNTNNAVSAITKDDEKDKYIKLIEQSKKRIGGILNKLNKMNIMLFLKGKNIVGIDKYVEQLKIQKANLNKVKRAIKNKSIDKNEYIYILFQIGSFLDLIFDNIASALEYNTCILKNIDTNLTLPSDLMYDIYSETIDQLMNNLNVKVKTKN